MTNRSWDTGDTEYDEVGGNRPVLVSLHFLRSALIRQWRVWVGVACVGAFLGLGWTFVMPAPSEGTSSVILAHESGSDPTLAMDTDVSLLRTRTVADSVIDELGLEMSPDDFQASVTAEPATSKVLVLTVAAPDDRAAMARVRALTENYLEFRSEQTRSQAEALVESYDKRVASLQEQVGELTEQYEALSGGGRRGQASDVITQRSQLTDEIDGLKGSISETTMETDSIEVASHVLDSASIVPRSLLRRVVLLTASGLIGGLALGVGFVLVRALTSDRLHRREEVALALRTPVRFSVGKKHHWSPWRRRAGAPSVSDLETLVRGLETAVCPHQERTVRLAVGAVDDARPAEQVVAALSTRLAHRGLSVLAVDLTEAGRLAEHTDFRSTAESQLTLLDRQERDGRDGELESLSRQRDEAEAHAAETRLLVDELTRAQTQADEAVQQARQDAALMEQLEELENKELELMEQSEEARHESEEGSSAAPFVFRPEGVPTLARGPIDVVPGLSSDVPDDSRRTWDSANVIVTLAEVDPAVGIDHLASWADRLVLMVTAGCSGAERLRSIGDLVRASDLELRFAMMVGTDRTDESLGLPEAADVEWQASGRSTSWA